MVLQLQAGCRDRLVAEIADRLRQLAVDGGVFLTDDSVSKLTGLDTVLPKTRGSIGLLGYFDEYALTAFVLDRISVELRTQPSADGIQPLTSIAAFSEPANAAARLVDEFATLPWSYSLFLKSEIPTEYQSLIGTAPLELGQEMRLVLPTDESISGRDLAQLLDFDDKIIAMSLRRDVPLQWDMSRFYLNMRADGFIGRYTSHSALTQMSAHVKAFYGLLLIFGFAWFEETHEGVSPKRPAVLRFGQPEGDGISWFPAEEGSQFGGIRFNTKTPVTKRLGTAFRNLIPLAFENDQELIRKSIRWYFDSVTGRNELLSFVQAMVALEILFGDSKKPQAGDPGVLKLISNRCAYSIAETAAERQEIIKNLDEIYETRSQIVHRGKDILTRVERQQLSRLHTLCERAIGHELWVVYNARNRIDT